MTLYWNNVLVFSHTRSFPAQVEPTLGVFGKRFYAISIQSISKNDHYQFRKRAPNSKQPNIRPALRWHSADRHHIPCQLALRIENDTAKTGKNITEVVSEAFLE
jgi:hypothetical protein